MEDGGMKKTSAQRLRENPDYYLNELMTNAERSRVVNYYKKNPRRKSQILELRKKYFNITGAGRKRRAWTDDEIEFLKREYKNMTALNIGLQLNRSWASIHHKLERLKLRIYYKWKKVIKEVKI